MAEKKCQIHSDFALAFSSQWLHGFHGILFSLFFNRMQISPRLIFSLLSLTVRSNNGNGQCHNANAALWHKDLSINLGWNTHRTRILSHVENEKERRHNFSDIFRNRDVFFSFLDFLPTDCNLLLACDQFLKYCERKALS